MDDTTAATATEAASSDTTPALYDLYRPSAFGEIYGQDSVVRSLEIIVAKQQIQPIIFAGPSGIGKTTLAYIVAAGFGCKKPDSLRDVDAAKYSGVENMREVVDELNYMPLSGARRRAVVVDECHMLSKAAWSSLLGPTERPPGHVLWLFCTTELNRVPDTIRTRCKIYTLKLLPTSQIKEIVTYVAKNEGFRLSEPIIDIIVSAAEGSPRRALSYLEECSAARSVGEVNELLNKIVDSEAAIELARLVLAGGNKGGWFDALKIINDKLKEQDPESMRITILLYMGGALRNAKTEKEAKRILEIMTQFEEPYKIGGLTPLLVSVARVLLYDS